MAFFYPKQNRGIPWIFFHGPEASDRSEATNGEGSVPNNGEQRRWAEMGGFHALLWKDMGVSKNWVSTIHSYLNGEYDYEPWDFGVPILRQIHIYESDIFEGIPGCLAMIMSAGYISVSIHHDFCSSAISVSYGTKTGPRDSCFTLSSAFILQNLVLGVVTLVTAIYGGTPSVVAAPSSWAAAPL